MKNTKLKILLCATKLFLEKGYTETYVTTIANSLNISTGNLTFHYPTKEHILAELVKQLCKLQLQVEVYKQEEQPLMYGYLVELAVLASVSEDNEKMYDLMMAVYTHPMSVEIIRKNDAWRAMKAFCEYCPKWTETDYIMAENIAFGIEYAMLRQENAERLSFRQRVESSMDAILKIYEVPVDVRGKVISEVMAMDYREKGSLVFDNFYLYLEEEMQKNKK